MPNLLNSRKLALILKAASSSTSLNSSSLDRGHSSKSILAAKNTFPPFSEKLYLCQTFPSFPFHSLTPSSVYQS